MSYLKDELKEQAKVYQKWIDDIIETKVDYKQEDVIESNLFYTNLQQLINYLQTIQDINKNVIIGRLQNTIKEGYNLYKVSHDPYKEELKNE